MDGTEQDQPQIPAQMDIGRTIGSGPRLDASAEKQHARAEQHRKDRPHPPLGHDECDRPGPEVGGAAVASDCRIVVGGERQAHRDDVDEEDTEHSKTAQRID